jgi:peptide/nickel transport system permease protein
MSTLTTLTPPGIENSAAAPAAVPPPVRLSSWQLLWRGPINKICLTVVTAYILVALLTLLPSPGDVPILRNVPGLRSIPNFDQLVAFKYDANNPYDPPAWSYLDENGVRHHSVGVWFGLDFQGHSVFWQVLYGARTALLITVCSSIFVVVIGTVMGMLAGYFGGWVDDSITWFYSVLSTIPWTLLVIAVTYTLKQNALVSDAPAVAPGAFGKFVDGLLPSDIVIIILALGLTDWVSLCRLIRGEVLKLRDSDMVAAGRALGLSETRILFRHILPNVSHLIIITITLGAVGYLQVEVVLSFIGLGVSSKPSWGKMIDDAKVTLLRGVWWEVTAATVAIFIICMALTLLGDALRDALDPKLRGRD